MSKTKLGNIDFSSDKEEEARNEMLTAFKENPLPDDEILSNLGLFLNSKNLSRILFFDFLYNKIIDKHGIIIEFGTRWGQNASILAALRGIYEPFNRHRKILAFDTFEGFININKKDGKSALMVDGADNVTNNYEKYLEHILTLQEKDNPISHIKKFEILKGDGPKKLAEYLKAHPETIVSLAYFDFDLYEPTKKCLEIIKPYLVKGSVLGFDELNDRDSPGETVALREVMGLNNIKLERYRYVSRTSYFIL